MDGPDLAGMDDPGSAGRSPAAPLGPNPGRGVLDGAFRLLRTLPETNGPGQLSELARATGIPRPSVHRLLTQLSSVGAVERQHGRRGVPGLTARVAAELGALAWKIAYEHWSDTARAGRANAHLQLRS